MNLADELREIQRNAARREIPEYLKGRIKERLRTKADQGTVVFLADELESFGRSYLEPICKWLESEGLTVQNNITGVKVSW